MSDTYCPLPWVASNLCPDNTMMPCCQYRREIPIKTTFTDTFNGQEYNLIRTKMLNSEKIDSCESCYKHEASGFESMRQGSIKRWGHVTTPSLKALEIEFDNVCNLKCRGCGSGNSHSWYEDEKELYGRTLSDKKYKFTTLYEQIDLSNIEELRFYGGEPLLSQRCEDFCKRLLESGSTPNLVLFTNGTVMPRPFTSKVFKQAKHLTIALSIDAYGKLNEYFRSGTKFDTVIANLKEYVKLAESRPPNTTTIQIHTTVNVYNVNKLEELDIFLREHFPSVTFSKECLQYPPWLSIKNLPKSYKEKIKSSLQNYPEVLTFLMQPGDDLFQHFVNFHTKLDSIRNEQMEGNDLLQAEIESYSTTDSSEYYNIYLKDLLD